MPSAPTLPRDTARRLRADQTEAEQKLWSRLRRHQMKGFQFRRQHPIGPFFADFVCLETKLSLSSMDRSMQIKRIVTKVEASSSVVWDTRC
jgi:very-short-patch-repair endonuclease